MQKREFVELAAPRFRVALFTYSGDDNFKNTTAVQIALDLWAEIEKQCPTQREFALQDWKVPT